MAEAGTTRTLRVHGMDCAGCAVAVRGALEAVSGVRQAEVDFAAGLAEVSGSAPVRELCVAVERAGYRAEAVESFDDPYALRAEVEARQAAALTAWRRRALVGTAIWVPLESLHWWAQATHAHATWVDGVMLAGSALSMLLVGSGFWRSAYAVLRHRRTNMDVLIALGATTAFVASLVTFLAQRRGALLDQPTWFSEAAALLAIISIGHWMEAAATRRAGQAVRELLELLPERVERLREGAPPEQVDTPSVRPGDRLRVRPGGRVPVDGVIEQGEAEVDEAVVTGESLPVARRPGERLAAGSLNLTGELVLRSEVDGRGTSLARVALQVQRAQASRAPIQALADRVAAVFVPVVLLLAVVTALGWGLAGNWATGVLAATTLLIISCPCALGIATPMAIMVGAGEASLRGVLVKDAASLERAGRVTRIWFDKTGTLTRGEPHVAAITPVDGHDPMQALAFAAAAERGSEHPIARAIVAHAVQRGVAVLPAERFTAAAGRGVTAQVQGRSVSVTRDAQASCVVQVDGQAWLRIEVRDQVRPEARGVVESLRSMALAVGMLTGDRAGEATRIAAEVGLSASEVRADLSPSDKASIVRASSATAAMVGDGVNDAAALAESGLGIAMGTGVSIAGESASVVLAGGRLEALPGLVRVGRETLRCIRQNLFLAFAYNALAMPAAAFALLGPKGPAIAALAMALSDVSVVGNAVRLKWRLARQRRASRAARSPSPAA